MPTNDFLAANQYRAYPFAQTPTASGVDIRGLLVSAFVSGPTPASAWTVSGVLVAGANATITLTGATAFVLSGQAGDCVTATDDGYTVTVIFGKIELPNGSYTVVDGELIQACVLGTEPGVKTLSTATELDPTITNDVIDPRYAYAATARDLTGALTLVEGANATLQLASGTLTITARPGAGSGRPTQRPILIDVDESGSSSVIDQNTSVPCHKAISSISGVAVSKLGQFNIYTGTGASLVSDPVAHKLTLTLKDIAELLPAATEEDDG